MRKENKKEFYKKNDLGCTYSRGKSTFKVFAPTAINVELVLYRDAGKYDDLGLLVSHEDYTAKLPMKLEEFGVWEITVAEDLKGQFYMYRVELPEGEINYAVDPYAKALSANGHRGAIIDFAETNPDNWDPHRRAELNSPTDAIIYEMHIRDFSISPDSGMRNKGKYLALTERGTKTPGGNSTGLDHLVELGVTHVQLLPIYDYVTVNELHYDPEDYNWGYDPQNYNAPEGSYSTDSTNPIARIKELKTAIQAIHDAGMRVIMDVVYNHTFSIDEGPFEKIAPGYYYRKTDEGVYTNGSGCGNEIASEAPMVRKFILDSILYWIEEFGIDGFRFDLMGLIDRETMKRIVRKVHTEIDSSILFLGEPWTGNVSALPIDQQALKGTQTNNGFSVFNDNLRNAIKGGSDDASQGFATGASGEEVNIIRGVEGSYRDFTAKPSESINYVIAHDNLNMWDKIVKTQDLDEEAGFIQILDGQLFGETLEKYGDVETAVLAANPYASVDFDNVLADECVRRSLLANGIVMTSQGIPFIYGGDEFLRTKFGDHNTYKSPDYVNMFRWGNKDKFLEVTKYYQGLIKLRKEHPAFRMNDVELIKKHLVFLEVDDKFIVFKLRLHANQDEWKDIVVAYNANEKAHKLDLPEAESWNVVVNDKKAGTEIIETIKDSHVSVPKLSMMVLYSMG